MSKLTRAAEKLKRAAEHAKQMQALERKAAKAAELPGGEDLSGALRRAEAGPAPGTVGTQIRGMQASQMTPDQAERLAGVGPEAGYLLPLEMQKTARTAGSVESVGRILDFLPKAKELAAVMKAGGAKKGWYRASAQALIDTFGQEDAPRFAALLAALSPQTSVETNLTNALQTWKNWNAAGRPTDGRAIEDVLARSVQGEKGSESVLNAWRNNSMAALQADDPRRITLSGPKVDSFMANLADDVYRVTNDAWNAKLLGVSQDLFRGSSQGPGDPGMRPGYSASSARMRHAADIAGMSPAEGQETSWSFAMQLYELSRSTGKPITELLESGQATDALIRGAPDFSSLFQQPQYRGILEEAGYGKQVGAMQPHQWPEMGGDIRSRVSPEEWQQVLSAGRRLDEVQNQAKRESFAQSYWNRSDTGGQQPVFGTYEAVPFQQGPGSHLEGMQNWPAGPKGTLSGTISSAFRNPANRDVLYDALGMPAIETRRGTGLWEPSPTAAIETNPAYAAGVEVPLTKGGGMRKADVEKMKAAEALRAYTTGQGAGAFSGMVPGGGPGYFVPREGKLPEATMQKLGDVARGNQLFVADTGMGVNLLPNPYGGQADLSVMMPDIRRALAVEHEAKAGKPAYTELPVLAPGSNVGDYIDYTGAWAQPQGSGAVARELFSHLDALPGKQQKALGGAIQQPAGDLYDIYRAQEQKGVPVREDLMNALKILREQGIEGLREALKRGDFIASLGPVLMPGRGLVPNYGEATV